MPKPMRVQCPLCKSRFDLGNFTPDRTIRCPECLERSQPVPVEAGAEAEPSPNAYMVQEPAARREEADKKLPDRASRRRQDEEDEPSRPRRRRLPNEDEAKGSGKPTRRMPPQFRMVHLGLWFYSACVVTSMVGILMDVMGPALIPAFRLGGGAIYFLYIVDTILAVVIALLGATGAVLCCRVPPQSGLRPLIYGALAGDALAVSLRFLAAFGAMLLALNVAAGAGAFAVLLGRGLAWFCSVGALVIFLFFLRNLASYMGETALAAEASAIFSQMVAAVVGLLVAYSLTCRSLGFLAREGRGDAFAAAAGLTLGVITLYVVGLIIVTCAVLVLVRIFHLIRSMREMLEGRSAGGKAPSLSELPAWAFLPIPVAAFLLLSCLIPPALFPARVSNAAAGPSAGEANVATGQPDREKRRPGPPDRQENEPDDLLPPKVPPPATDFPGLIAYWPFEDDDPARQIIDQSGLGNDGSAPGATRVDGIRGKGLALAGKSFFDYGSRPGLNFASGEDFSVACWLKTRSPTGTLLSQRNSVDKQAMIALFLSGGQLKAHVRPDRSIFNLDLGTRKRIDDDHWHHCALIRSGKEGRLYLDGSQVAKGQSFPEAGPITTDLRGIGQERRWERGLRFNSSPDFTGAVDECCIFNRALTSDEIKSLAGR